MATPKRVEKTKRQSSPLRHAHLREQSTTRRRNVALLYDAPSTGRRETDARTCPPQIVHSDRADGMFDRQALVAALGSEGKPALRQTRYTTGGETYRLVGLYRRADDPDAGSVRYKFNEAEIVANGPVLVVNERYLTR